MKIYKVKNEIPSSSMKYVEISNKKNKISECMSCRVSSALFFMVLVFDTVC